MYQKIYILIFLVVLLISGLIYMIITNFFFKNTINKQIYNCVESNIRNERIKISNNKKKEIKPIKKCLKKYGMNTELQGSVLTNMSQPHSDIDLLLTEGNIQDCVKCGFKKKKNSNNIFRAYTSNGTKVDLSQSKNNSVSKYKNLYEKNNKNDISEQLKDILYCTNKYINKLNYDKKIKIMNKHNPEIIDIIPYNLKWPFDNKNSQSNLNLFIRK